MSYRMAENFVQKRGVEKLLWVASALNSGVLLEDVASELELSPGRLSQIVTKVFVKRFVFSPGAEDYLQFYLNACDRCQDEFRKALDNNVESRLRYIPGNRIGGPNRLQ